MGIIDKFRNKVNEKNNDMDIKANNMPIVINRSDGANLALSNVKTQIIPYTDGTYTKIITGKISISDRKNRLNISDGKPICIEVPYDMQVDENFVSYFDQIGLFNNLQSESYNILGRLVGNGENWSINQISPDLVNGYIQNLNNEYIQEKANRMEKQQESARLIHEHSLEHIYNNEQKAQEYNKVKPFFRQSSYQAINGTIEEQYIMTDLVTRDKMSLFNVKKIGKDEFGTYLYSAYVNKKLGQAGLLNKPDELYPVLFSTVQKLDEICRLQNPEMVERISQLFSGKSLSQESMTYLGQLNWDGIEENINKVSDTIKDSVYMLQIEYMKQQLNEQIEDRDI